MKDYCTWFPDNWKGVYIGDCCKIHDEECSTSKFLKCLYKKVGLHSVYITAGGALGCWIKYTKKMIGRI